MLKKKFPSLASIGSDGNTAFLRAARAGHIDKVLEQLKNNVDINTSNANGLNALHLASKDGHINVVSELLKRGAKVDSATKKGNTALHIASLAGQEEVVKHLVDNGASVNVQSQNGFTPLYMAAQENHDTVVRFLLANGANQSLATEDGFTPLAVAMQQGHDKVVAVLLENDTRGKVRLPALHIAAKKDDCKAAALLLQNEHNPDVTSKSGFTPLHIASHYGNEAIANLLLSKGADVNYAAKHNITPLHVAAKWGKANMVSVLLSKGANIEAKTRDGLTPLHCAARSGHEQVVDMLLERGAPISAKTKNGLAALHMAAQGDHVDAARILLYHRAPVDDVTVDYLTALHVAAHCGHVGVARLLLDRKADPNARALNGFTPLHIACKKNRIKVVELLLKHGASIEATTESGLTPLHVASFMGCMNIVIYLVQNEAGPDVKTVRGETPLHLAARANQTDIIRILLRNGAQVDARAREQQTPLHIASRLGNVDIVMLLLQHGASVDSTTKDLYTALHIAAKEGQDEVASVLLENGASLDATTKKGFTPLHLAAKYGHMNVAKLLLRRDAPVDAQGKNGVTPLHVASHYDHQNVALLLLEKGASPHATAKNGHTPLHIAARKNQMDIATTLLEYGAKANAESKAGFTPLHLSAQEGHADMSNLLIEHQADVNHKAKNGLTPLHLCSQEDRVEVGNILLKNKSDVNSTTKAGYTPLHVACHFGQMGMVRLLLANGASVTPTTAVNYTPLHQAAQQGHSVIVNTLLTAGADPNATTNQGQTAMSIAQKLGYISVMETLKGVTDAPISPTSVDEKYKVVSPETMQETFMSDSEDEGGEDTMLSEQPYHYLTVDEMKGLGDDSLPIDVTRDERDNRDFGPPTAIDDTVSPQHMKESYASYGAPDNVDIHRHPLHIGFLVSFLVDARGGAMRGVRHSGVRVIVPPRRAPMPLRVTCRYLKRDKLPHPPPLMEGEALASRILELGPVGAKFLGPVMIEVPHFGSLRGKEREIVILRSDNGETWREHTFEATEEAVHDVLSHSFEKDEINQFEEGGRTTRILTTEFPHYIAVVSRVRQEVHAIGPEGGMVSSTVVPQVQAVFPHGALTKKIKVGLQAQPIPADLTAKLLGNRVAVSPIVTVEPRRRKFHKPISLTIPVPQAANKGMINQYSGDAPTLRLLCSITGGTTRAQWEDVTGSTPLTFVNDCVSFTTTVSARFWLMDCRNISEATKMATELYKEAIHVPFMAKFVVFAKRVDTTEARLRVFCMTDDKEDKTLEHQEHFTEVAKSRDVEVLEGKHQYLEFAGNLIPVTKSGEQLQLGFRAFKENRLPFTARVKDLHADAIGRIIFMREPKVAKGDVPQQPICILNIVLPEDIIPEPDIPEHDAHKHSYITHTSGLQRLSDISNLLGEDWVRLAGELGISTSEVNSIKTDLCESSVAHQGLAMLRQWLQSAGNKASASTLEQGLRNIGREDIIQQTVFQSGTYALAEELSPSYTTKQGIFKRAPVETHEIIEERIIAKDPQRESTIEERLTKKEERRRTLEKDDGDEKKYVAEEKAVEEESLRSVSERKREIEKRLSQEVEDKTRDKSKETKIDGKSLSDVVCSTEGETEIKKPVKEEKGKIQLLDDSMEKEISEEKAVSPEPAHLSFDEKRKSFEMGITPKEKIKQQEVTAQFLAGEKKAAQELETTKEKEELARFEEEEEKEMSFAEKRRSFEQGLVLKQPGDKLPAAERKKEAASIRKGEDEKRSSDFRRDSELFQEVSQGLDNIEKGFTKPVAQDLLSPALSKTPPPSPADFNKETPDNKKWSVETTSNVLSSQEDKPQEAVKSKGAVETSWQTREGQSVEEEMPLQSEESHILSPKEERKDNLESTVEMDDRNKRGISTKPLTPQQMKKTDDKTKESSKNGKKKAQVEETVKKTVIESKKPTGEKKGSIIEKTIESIKKPFQDKSGDKTVGKEGKDKGKGDKGKGDDRKSAVSMESSSGESKSVAKEETATKTKVDSTPSKLPASSKLESQKMFLEAEKQQSIQNEGLTEVPTWSSQESKSGSESPEKQVMEIKDRFPEADKAKDKIGEIPQQKDRGGKGKGSKGGKKDKPVEREEPKKKGEANLMEKTLGAIKKPFQDQAKKKDEPKPTAGNKKVGDKRQKSIDSSKSSSSEKETEEESQQGKAKGKIKTGSPSPEKDKLVKNEIKSKFGKEPTNRDTKSPQGSMKMGKEKADSKSSEAVVKGENGKKVDTKSTKVVANGEKDKKLNAKSPEAVVKGEKDKKVDAKSPEANVKGEKETKVEKKSPEAVVKGKKETKVEKKSPEAVVKGDKVKKADVKSPEAVVKGEKDKKVDAKSPEAVVKGEKETKVEDKSPEAVVKGDKVKKADVKSSEAVAKGEKDKKVDSKGPKVVAKSEKDKKLNRKSPESEIKDERKSPEKNVAERKAIKSPDAPSKGGKQKDKADRVDTPLTESKDKTNKATPEEIKQKSREKDAESKKKDVKQQKSLSPSSSEEASAKGKLMKQPTIEKAVEIVTETLIGLPDEQFETVGDGTQKDDLQKGVELLSETYKITATEKEPHKKISRQSTLEKAVEIVTESLIGSAEGRSERGATPVLANDDSGKKGNEKPEVSVETFEIKVTDTRSREPIKQQLSVEKAVGIVTEALIGLPDGEFLKTQALISDGADSKLPKPLSSVDKSKTQDFITKESEPLELPGKPAAATVRTDHIDHDQDKVKSQIIVEKTITSIIGQPSANIEADFDLIRERIAVCPPKIAEASKQSFEQRSEQELNLVEVPKFNENVLNQTLADNFSAAEETNTAGVGKAKQSAQVYDPFKSAQGQPSSHPEEMKVKSTTEGLLEQLHSAESGVQIEEKPIELVTKPFDDITLGGLTSKERRSKEPEPKKAKSNQKGAKKEEFDYIQKTIDDAMMKFDTFVGIVSEKGAKPTMIEEKPIGDGEIVEKPLPLNQGTLKEIDIPLRTEEKKRIEIVRSVDESLKDKGDEVEKIKSQIVEPTSIGVGILKTNPFGRPDEGKKDEVPFGKGPLETSQIEISDTLSLFQDKVIEGTSQIQPQIDSSFSRAEKILDATDVTSQQLGKTAVDKLEYIVTTPISQVTKGVDTVISGKDSTMKPQTDSKDQLSSEIGLIKDEKKDLTDVFPASMMYDVTLAGVEKTIKSSADDALGWVKPQIQTMVGQLPGTEISTKDEQPKVKVQTERDSMLSGNFAVEPIASQGGVIESLLGKIAPSELGEIKEKTVEDSIKFEQWTEPTLTGIEQTLKNSGTTVEKTIMATTEEARGKLESMTSSYFVDVPSGDSKEDIFKGKFDEIKPLIDDGVAIKDQIEEAAPSVFSKIERGITVIQKATVPKLAGRQQSTEDKNAPSQEEALAIDAQLNASKVTSETFSPLAMRKTILTTETTTEQTLPREAPNDEIGKRIKEMEQELLSTRFKIDDLTGDSDSEKRSGSSGPSTPTPAKRDMTGKIETHSTKPFVTTPTQSRRITGIGGSQRLSEADRPIVRVVTEYLGDSSGSEPEDNGTYTVLEPEVRERRTFKIRFSPDIYKNEDIVEVPLPADILEEGATSADKQIRRIDRHFERLTSLTKEADPSMSETTDNEFQRIVSHLSTEEMDDALHQWDVGGLTPSEIDSKDLTLTSDDSTSPLQQGLSDIFRPTLSTILMTPIYVEKSEGNSSAGGAGVMESGKMKLSLVKDSVPKVFVSQEVEREEEERDEEPNQGAYGLADPQIKDEEDKPLKK